MLQEKIFHTCWQPRTAEIASRAHLQRQNRHRQWWWRRHAGWCPAEARFVQHRAVRSTDWGAASASIDRCPSFGWLALQLQAIAASAAVQLPEGGIIGRLAWLLPCPLLLPSRRLGMRGKC